MSPVRVNGRWATALVAVGAVTAAVVAFALTRGLTFYFDEWAFIGQRQANDLDTLLRPYNQHVVLLPLLVYKALFQVFGLVHYWPYRAVVIGLHLACAVLLFIIARRRIGYALAPIPPLVLLFLGPGWEDILWPFQIGFVMPLAAALGALLALDRGDRAGDLVGGGLLLVAVASGSLAAPVAVGVGVELLLGPDRLRRLARVVLVPASLYGAWLLVYNDQIAAYRNELALLGIHSPSIWSLPGFVADSISASLAAVVSIDPAWGWLPASLLAIAIIARLARRPSDSKRLLALVVMTLIYWSLVGEFRPFNSGSPPSRYMYVGALFALLIVVELLRGVRLRRGSFALAYGLAAVLIASNIPELEQGSDRLHRVSDFVAPGFGALELAGERTDPAFVPEPGLAPYINAGQYFSAIAQFGSPALPAAQIPQRPEEVRLASDAVLAAALRPRLRPSALPAKPGPPPTVLPTHGVRVLRSRGCLQIVLRVDNASFQLALPSRGLAVHAAPGPPVQLRLRRFADGFDPPSAIGIEDIDAFNTFVEPTVLELPAGASRLLRLRPDGLARPWHVEMFASQPLLACALPPGQPH